jgi:putative ABC transport system substrate-binding protein
MVGCSPFFGAWGRTGKVIEAWGAEKSMGVIIKRLSLGFSLIALTSGVLLVSDWGRRSGGGSHKPQGASLQHASQPVLTASRPLLKKWKVHLIELNNILDVEETEQGIMEGLGQANLAAGRDYEIAISNAQGDMATVIGLVDSALSQGADLLITLSTPTLQAALQRAQRVPIVFTYVANGILAGAGRNNEDHLPNVTGISIVGAYGDMISLLRQCLPSARRIGTLFVPAEVNMVFNKDQLVEAAGKTGIEVVPVAVSTSSEIPDAALALMSRNIDALCQIPGNLTAGAFGGIAQAARKAKLPIFAFQKVQAREGAVITLARDYHDAGRGAAFLAARIMRGEKPASIPLQSLNKTNLIINLEAARASGLSVPPSLLSKADEVIGR